MNRLKKAGFTVALLGAFCIHSGLGAVSLHDLSSLGYVWPDREWFSDFHRNFVHHGGTFSDVNMYEDDSHIYVEAALPGVKKEDVELTLEKGVLSIQGKRVMDEEEEVQRYHSSNSYNYRLKLPSSVDESKDPEATFEDGLMRLIFDKKETAQPRRIQFKS